MHEVDVRYTKALVHAAVRAFYWRTLGRAYWLALALSIPVALFVSLLLEGNRSWLVGALGAFLLSFLVYLLVLYQAHHRNTVGAFRRLGKPQGRFVFSDSGVAISSDVGSANVPWSAIQCVWTFPRFWLFLTSPSSFFTLPTDGVGEDTLAFIRSKTKIS
jgi:YcxB-like protein